MRTFRAIVAVLSVLSIGVGGSVFAASTIGTNISTTGTLTVTSDSATAVQFQNAAGTTTVFAIDASNTRAGVNAGGTVDTTFEVGGTASISGFTILYSHASVAGNFELTSSSALLGVNAGGTIDTMFEVGGTASISGFTRFGANASVGGNFELTSSSALFGINAGATINTMFEVGGTASISSVFALTNFVAGRNTASSSTAYVAEFSPTGTTSLLLHGTTTNKGTCLQMRNAAGTIVYARVEGTTLTINTTKCHP